MITSLHVLITRPEPKAQQLAALIRQKGGNASVYPAFSIEDPLDKQALQVDIEALANTDIAIFVSPNAVEKTMPFWRAYWKKPPKNLSIVAVGKSTQQLLNSYKIDEVLAPEEEFNSEALLAFPQLQEVEGKRITIFQGETGRGLLEKILVERGAVVKIAVAYRRVLSPPIPESLLLTWQEKNVNCVIYTSAEGMLSFFKLVDLAYHGWLKNLTSLVISERLIETAKEMGIKSVIQSRNASLFEITEALLLKKFGNCL